MDAAAEIADVQSEGYITGYAFTAVYMDGREHSKNKTTSTMILCLLERVLVVIEYNYKPLIFLGSHVKARPTLYDLELRISSRQ